MTQILTALTRQYVILASDRQLTFTTGDRKGEVAEDDACKLVSFNHLFGIGYSGAAQLDGSPTHEWIAKTLATGGAQDVDEATTVLARNATLAVEALPPDLRRLTLVVAGWEKFEGPSGLSPHACFISNAHDSEGRPLLVATNEFQRRILVLRPDADNSLIVIGEVLDESRRTHLKRNLRRLDDRMAGPTEAMRLLVDEIVNTHKHGNGTVGHRVLAFCIPRLSVEKFLLTGSASMAGILPLAHCSTFAYFDAGFSKLRQQAPTVVCGNQAAVIETIENDPVAGGVRRLAFRMLTAP
jgi:hypothetical protein